MKKQITVGIIGAGRIGRVHAQSIAHHIPGARIKTIADVFMNEETKKWAENLGVENTTRDYMDILNDPEIEAVLICSSTNTHAQFTIASARAGKHIFCEKPLDPSVERIKETLKVVEEAGVKFQIGFNRRFDHNFKAVKKTIIDGKIGEPHIIRITSRDPEPPNPEYVKVSGGIFMDMTIHDFDMARFLSASEVEEVYVQGAAEVFGSGGAVETSNDSLSSAVVSTASGIESEKPLYFFLERYMASFTQEMKEFFEAVSNNTETPVGPLDALRPVQIANAAGESLRTGLPVKVES